VSHSEITAPRAEATVLIAHLTAPRVEPTIHGAEITVPYPEVIATDLQHIATAWRPDTLASGAHHTAYLTHQAEMLMQTAQGTMLESLPAVEPFSTPRRQARRRGQDRAQ
jgi:hypothetical protein